MNISRKHILLYTLTPQIMPRLRNLLATGFAQIAYFIALVYSAVRLLPVNHAYTNPDNIGKFGIRHVIGEAANNLKLSLQNIDQIILFITILIGLSIIIVQIILLIGGLFMQPVMAAMPTNFAGFFLSPNPEQDLAGMMMDMVFGVPNVFKSCITGAAACLDTDGKPLNNIMTLTNEYGWPYPIHVGLHQMLQVYSLGLMAVGAMITIYFMITVIAETAQSGTPFGKRFQHVWAPIRIVMAFGLLIPLGYGLNSAQYITLYAAKFGSGFATNGWLIFNQSLNDTYLGEKEKLVAEPNIPEVGNLIQFMFTALTCKELENEDPNEKREVKAYFVKNVENQTSNLEFKSYTDYDDIIKFIAGSKVATLRFGIEDKTEYSNFAGNVSPICGEVKITLTDPRPKDQADPAAYIMQKSYLRILDDLWFDPEHSYMYDPVGIVQNYSKIQKDDSNFPPDNDMARGSYQFFNRDLSYDIEDAVEAETKNGRWDIESNLLAKGWGAAGIWYNKIAEMNGVVTTAILNVPRVHQYPAVMEEVFLKKRRNNKTVNPLTRFEPTPLDKGKPLHLKSRPEALHKADVMWVAYEYWNDVSSSSHTASTGNTFMDFVNVLLGTNGLFSMRKNEDVHPLAQLSVVGKSLVESAINNIGYATILAVGSAGLRAIADLQFLGDLAAVGSGFIVTIAMMGLTIGILLFYFIPFLPFMYFFFAVGGWVKGIFEALVGVPLWALAHIRIDGEGLPGKAAANGYFLIFEIFIRPLLIVFGLIASISIFSAMVAVLNDVWDLVIANLTGFDVKTESESNGVDSMGQFFRSGIDEFFYTCVYGVVVYILGLSSFKLIDEIPNNIMRWMGQGVQGFNDNREDPTTGLMGTAYTGTQQFLKQAGGTTKQGLQSISSVGSGKKGGAGGGGKGAGGGADSGGGKAK